MRTAMKRLMTLALLPLLTLGQHAHSQDNDVIDRTFCVWDPVGSNGRLFSLMESQRPLALEQGVDLKLRAFTNEHIAAEEFRNGQCDQVLLTGTMAGDFNSFTGSLDAMGAIPGEEAVAGTRSGESPGASAFRGIRGGRCTAGGLALPVSAGPLHQSGGAPSG